MRNRGQTSEEAELRGTGAFPSTAWEGGESHTDWRGKNFAFSAGGLALYEPGALLQGADERRAFGAKQIPSTAWARGGNFRHQTSDLRSQITFHLGRRVRGSVSHMRRPP